eukprot:TRINITY_DN23983_c0_g2_i1.p1 TRINITY_DN23983_c0_g2~~TRINITY_DN23983_c0_g2_i1.p1  ORF type:complete len:522 (+),score=121.76 TRINITY_DN23983_c0_g2_i1:114-1568(+)
MASAYQGLTMQVARQLQLVDPPRSAAAKPKKRKPCGKVFPGAIVNVTCGEKAMVHSASTDTLGQPAGRLSHSHSNATMSDVDCHNGASDSQQATAHGTPVSAPTPSPSPSVNLSGLNYVSEYNQQYDRETRKVSHSDQREKEFEKTLRKSEIDLGEDAEEGFRKLAWMGIPSKHRPESWRLLTGYMPVVESRRQKALKRKREEYREYVDRYYESDGKILEDGSYSIAEGAPRPPEQELQMRHQIHIDVPRTLHEYPLFRTRTIKNMMERVLYVWSIRNPASGYVQGINDLTTPFFMTFLSEHLEMDRLLSAPVEECEGVLSQKLTPEVMGSIEADIYWCLTYLLRQVHGNFTAGQMGLQAMVARLRSVIEKHEPGLLSHLDEMGLEFLQFSFRWMNCLLVRELPLQLGTRLWDTYLAEGQDYPTLHVYVCAALMIHWKEALMERDFGDSMIFLHSLGKRHVFIHDLEKWISHAYVLRHLYEPTQ